MTDQTIKKMSYADVLCKNYKSDTNQIYSETKFKKNKSKNQFVIESKSKFASDLNNRIKMLVNKIFKHAKYNANYQLFMREVVKRILQTDNNSSSIVKSMININNLINSNNIIKFIDIDTSNKNHKWVSDKLTTIIINEYTNIMLKFGLNVSNLSNSSDVFESSETLNSSDISNSLNLSNLRIADIGGGEGDVINYIGLNLNMNLNNLFCIESQNSWAESYQYKNSIQYIFWDNETINIEHNSLDVIIIMVSMHHMLNSTIDKLLTNIKLLLKSTGFVIIKEHDCLNDQHKFVIDWEHHLYHIMMSSNDKLTNDECFTYINNFISNYKSKSAFDELFVNNGFIIGPELDRGLKPINTNIDISNATNLYWRIYYNN